VPTLRVPILHADDDHEIVWESGGRRASDREHRRCVCHTDPILGDRHDVHTHEWEVHATAGGLVNRLKALGRILGDVDPD
jgi:hypothetical protein